MWGRKKRVWRSAFKTNKFKLIYDNSLFISSTQFHGTKMWKWRKGSRQTWCLHWSLGVILLKFHCELNHIEYFWCNTYKNYTYTAEILRDVVPQILEWVKHFTFFEYFNSCMKKIDRYKKDVKYDFLYWKKLISYQKPWNRKDDDH